MSERTWLMGAGIALAIAFALGLTLIGARGYMLDNFEHAVVRLFNVDDLMTVSVNCRVARVVPADRTATVDLGWLQDSDHVYVSAYNMRYRAAWGYRFDVNSKRVDGDSRGAASSAGYEAAEHAVVMALGYGANGERLGTVGCAGPNIVSPELSQYSRVAEASPKGGRPLPRWEAATFPFSLIDTLGRWAPIALAALGFLSALASARIRAFVIERWEWGFVITVISLLIALGTYGLDAIVTTVLITGTALLPLTAFLCLQKSRKTEEGESP